jgi:hypothetical protein
MLLLVKGSLALSGSNEASKCFFDPLSKNNFTPSGRFQPSRKWARSGIKINYLRPEPTVSNAAIKGLAAARFRARGNGLVEGILLAFVTGYFISFVSKFNRVCCMIEPALPLHAQPHFIKLTLSFLGSAEEVMLRAGE